MHTNLPLFYVVCQASCRTILTPGGEFKGPVWVKHEVSPLSRRDFFVQCVLALDVVSFQRPERVLRILLIQRGIGRMQFLERLGEAGPEG